MLTLESIESVHLPGKGLDGKMVNFSPFYLSAQQRLPQPKPMAGSRVGVPAAACTQLVAVKVSETYVVLQIGGICALTAASDQKVQTEGPLATVVKCDPHGNHKEIATEYIQKKMRKEHKCFMTKKNQLNSKGDNNAGNEGQKAVRHAETNSKTTNSSLPVIV